MKWKTTNIKCQNKNNNWEKFTLGKLCQFVVKYPKDFRSKARDFQRIISVKNTVCSTENKSWAGDTVALPLDANSPHKVNICREFGKALGSFMEMNWINAHISCRLCSVQAWPKRQNKKSHRDVCTATLAHISVWKRVRTLPKLGRIFWSFVHPRTLQNVRLGCKGAFVLLFSFCYTTSLLWNSLSRWIIKIVQLSSTTRFPTKWTIKASQLCNFSPVAIILLQSLPGQTITRSPFTEAK